MGGGRYESKGMETAACTRSHWDSPPCDPPQLGVLRAKRISGFWDLLASCTAPHPSSQLGGGEL